VRNDGREGEKEMRLSTLYLIFQNIAALEELRKTCESYEIKGGLVQAKKDKQREKKVRIKRGEEKKGANLRERKREMQRIGKRKRAAAKGRPR